MVVERSNTSASGHWYCSVTITGRAAISPEEFIECQFNDRFGREWILIEKLAVVSDAWLDRNTHFPQPASIACRVISWGHDESNRLFAHISTEEPWHIEAIDGTTRFEVFANQLSEL